VKKRLLLDGITLDAANISPGDVELTAAVEADFADAGLSLRNRTAVATSKAADAVAVDRFVEIALPDLFIEDFAQCRHGTALEIF
jgi:hypothetical protein